MLAQSEQSPTFLLISYYGFNSEVAFDLLSKFPVPTAKLSVPTAFSLDATHAGCVLANAMEGMGLPFLSRKGQRLYKTDIPGVLCTEGKKFHHICQYEHICPAG